MNNKVGVYFCIEEIYGNYRLNYIIKNISTEKIFINLKKKLKNEDKNEVIIESLEYLFNNILSLIKLNEVSKDSEINIFTDNLKALNIISKKNYKNYKNLKFFIEKVKIYNCEEFKKVEIFIKHQDKAPIEIYLECKKAGKEYRKILKRNSTLSILKEKYTKADSLVFLDFEMNCLVDFKSVEIISVGLCKVNLRTKDISRFYSLIKPQEIYELTDKCVEITGLNQEEINTAKSFNEIFEEIKNWINSDKALYFYWGGNDISVLKNDYKRNSMISKAALQILRNNIDFQEVLCKDILLQEDMLSLTNALIKYDLEFKGMQHNSGDDAYNLYRLFKKIQKIDNYYNKK